MTKRMQIYKCEICGNIVEMVHDGAGELVCCNEPMKLYEENAVDAATEKHVPVAEKTEAGLRVKVGSVPHPMEEKHYIEWIQVVDGEKNCRTFLKPGDEPMATFETGPDGVFPRAYCNLHGLWKG